MNLIKSLVWEGAWVGWSLCAGFWNLMEAARSASLGSSWGWLSLAVALLMFGMFWFGLRKINRTMKRLRAAEQRTIHPAYFGYRG